VCYCYVFDFKCFLDIFSFVLNVEKDSVDIFVFFNFFVDIVTVFISTFLMSVDKGFGIIIVDCCTL